MISATYLDASNLFDQIADIVCVCVCVCVHMVAYPGSVSWGLLVRVSACVCVLLACGVVQQPSGAVLWSVTFV